MAAKLNAHLFELEWTGAKWARYPALCWRTYRLVRCARPEVVFFQNPSIVLGAFLALLKVVRLTSAIIVGDYHNAGVNPQIGGHLTRWIARSSHLIIVSNDNLGAVVSAWGARSIALPDPLPVIHAPDVSGDRRRDQEFVFLFICSWADDEPIANVISAIALLRHTHPHFRLLVTGRPKLEKFLSTPELPDAVRLTGFLSTDDFDRLLGKVDVVIDLTLRPDCMVCGAYEAVSAGKPAILSDNGATRSYFRQGMLFTDNTSADIAKRMVESYERFNALNGEVKLLKRDIQNAEMGNFRRFEMLMGSA